MDKPSKRFSLNTTDWKNQAKSAFVFLAPSILAFLLALTPQVDALVPDTKNKMLLVIAVKWGLDQLTGIVRRYVAGK